MGFKAAVTTFLLLLLLLLFCLNFPNFNLKYALYLLSPFTRALFTAAQPTSSFPMAWLGSAWLSPPMWARAVVELLPLKVSQITVNAAFSCNAPSEFVMILLQIVAFVLNNNTVVGGTWGEKQKRWEPSMGI